MSDKTPINPSAGLPEDGNEDLFESMLDAESDEDFGYVVTKDRANGPDGHPVKLADWSAQDFASIYTRFRPHLERHARRYLNNPSQVDEVVQDAFLYLMVSLPELDSEIGVLRFLKWKTRLLCLDVSRASGKAYVANIDDVAEPMSQDPEVSSYLEQQDDAAVLRLALSKLNPRHREVLLASIYEEKSTDQIAAQVGLSENATRQLIFRARSAFKKALLGDDLDTSGMSAAAILSVAARKAAQEAKKVGAQAMIFVLFLALAIGAFINFVSHGEPTNQLAQPLTSSSASETKSTELDESAKVPSKLEISNSRSLIKVSNRISASSDKAVVFNESELSRLFGAEPQQVSVFRLSSQLSDSEAKQQYRLVATNGLVAEFTFNVKMKNPFSDVLFKLDLEGSQFQAFPDSFDFFRVTDSKGTIHLIYFGSLTYVFDDDGKIWSNSEISKGTVRLEVTFDQSDSNITSAVLSVIQSNN